jgi:hypothetical protein
MSNLQARADRVNDYLRIVEVTIWSTVFSPPSISDCRPKFGGRPENWDATKLTVAIGSSGLARRTIDAGFFIGD